MAARARARKRALDVLYEAEIRGLSPSEVLETRESAADPPLNPYVRELVGGVLTHQQRIDALLDEHATGWSLARMPMVDRNILRIGAYELLFAEQVPDPVAISESVRLATELCGEESPMFVNGLLGRLQELKPTLG